MRVFRGTRDILPHEVDHRRVSPAVYGAATYFALHESDGFHYAQGGYGDCQVVVTYNLPVTKVLQITDRDWEKIGVVSDAKKPLAISHRFQELLDYQERILSPVNLAKVAKQSGFEAVVLTGHIEGGEQVVVPENEVLPEVLSYKVKMSKELCGHNKQEDTVSQFLKKLNEVGVVAAESNYYLEFSLTPSQLASLTPVFEFLKTTRRRSFYGVDFNNLSVEPYDGDE